MERLLRAEKNVIKNIIPEIDKTNLLGLAVKRQETRLLRQQYDKSVVVRHYDLDEKILPEKSISSISFLKDSRLGFEYPDDVVIQFLSALATKQIIVLFGKPGTGKTTFVREMAKALGVFFATPKCRKLQNKNVGFCNCIFHKLAETWAGWFIPARNPCKQCLSLLFGIKGHINIFKADAIA